MPPAKKESTRAGGRSAAAPSPASTRREVERSIKRWEKSLDDATQALQALARDSGKGAKSAYRDLTKALTSLRRDAQKTNRNLIKDLEQLAAAVASGAGVRSTSRASASRATRARRPASSRSTSARSANSADSDTAAKKTTTSRTGKTASSSRGS
jgi:hypothetical protein